MSYPQDDTKTGIGGPSGRSFITWNKEGKDVTRLVEWSIEAPEPFEGHVARVKERVATDKDVNRPEEARTFKIEFYFRDGPRSCLVYRCFPPISLREVLQHVPRPSPEERRKLGGIIATQVRSLHIHSEMLHMALRTESFVFLSQADKLDYTSPYILDWTRPPSPIHQHPDYRADKPLWFYDAWSLTMILSEIADWRPLEYADQDGEKLLEWKLNRKKLVKSSDWKGAPTAEIFKYSFDIFDKGHDELGKLSKWEVKRFYDGLCERLR